MTTMLQALAIGGGIFIGNLLWAVFVAVFQYWDYKRNIIPQQEAMKSELLRFAKQRQLDPHDDDDFRVN